MNFENLKPIKNYKLVRFETVELKTESGIITGINKSVIKDRPTSGVVIAEGPDSKHKLIGKKVYFENVSGVDLDKNHLILKEDSILGFEN